MVAPCLECELSTATLPSILPNSSFLPFQKEVSRERGVEQNVSHPAHNSVPPQLLPCPQVFEKAGGIKRAGVVVVE